MTEYEQALDLVAEKEQEMLDTLQVAFQQIKDCADAVQSSLLTYKNSLPSTTVNVSKARAVVEQAYSSVVGLQQQAGYMLDTVNANLAQYTPAEELPLPPPAG